jgi:hypothetical protein
VCLALLYELTTGIQLDWTLIHELTSQRQLESLRYLRVLRFSLGLPRDEEVLYVGIHQGCLLLDSFSFLQGEVLPESFWPMQD